MASSPIWRGIPDHASETLMGHVGDAYRVYTRVSVIPELRVTDLGLVDVRTRAVVPLQGAGESSDEARA